MKQIVLIIIIGVMLVATVPVLAKGPNAYVADDLYCIEVGWDAESQEYFNTHHVDCKFINVFRSGKFYLDMYAEIPREGDICHLIDESTNPPTFSDVPCEYTYADYVAAGSPSVYVIEGQTCLANFLFMINEGLTFEELVWGISPVVTFTPGGNIHSYCIGQ